MGAKSYRTYNDPAHFGHTVCGVTAETVALHREHSNSLIFGILARYQCGICTRKVDHDRSMRLPLLS